MLLGDDEVVVLPARGGGAVEGFDVFCDTMIGSTDEEELLEGETVLMSAFIGSE